MIKFQSSVLLDTFGIDVECKPFYPSADIDTRDDVIEGFINQDSYFYNCCYFKEFIEKYQSIKLISL